MNTRACSLAALVACLLAGCSTKQTAPVSVGITPEKVAAFCRVALQSVLGSSMPSPDRRAVLRLASISNKIVPGTGKKYQVSLVMAQPIRTAVPVPLDAVVVSEQMAAALSDSELAAIVAHQIGHLESHHPFEKLKNLTLAQGRTGQAVLESWDSKTPNPEVLALADKVWTLPYTQAEEEQANSVAAMLLQKAGYATDSLAKARDDLGKKAQPEQQGPVNYLAQHPAKI